MDDRGVIIEDDLEIFDDIDLNSTLKIEEVKQTINKIQEQGGKVDKEKFLIIMMTFLPRSNMEENKNKLDKLFDRLDRFGENLITVRQVMLVDIAFSSVNLKDKLTKIFKLVDENDDGELTYEEFEEVIKDILVLKEEQKMATSSLEKLFCQTSFRDMGVNDDGKVKLSRFVEACTRQKFIFINYVENFKDGFLIKDQS